MNFALTAEKIQRIDDLLEERIDVMAVFISTGRNGCVTRLHQIQTELYELTGEEKYIK